jgi:hypothetical protein
MRGRTAVAPAPPEQSTLGRVNPGTTGTGIIALRVFAVGAAIALVAAVRPVNTKVQQMWAALHNWAGPEADRLGHFHHAGPAIHVKTTGRGLLATSMGHAWTWTAVIAGAVLLTWAALAANKLRSPTPGSLAARGLATIAGVVLAVLVCVAALVWGLTLVEPGRVALAGALRGIAWCARYLQQGAADLIGTQPTPITHLTGGTR